MKLLVEIDGETHSLGDCHWILKNGAGCAVGSVWAGADVATAELAHREFSPQKRDRVRQIREGYTLELIPRDRWKDRFQACFMVACGHRATT